MKNAKLRLLCFSIILALITRCGGDDTDTETCTAGQLNCSCYPNGTCDVGLTCSSGVCVSATSIDSGNPNSNAGGSVASGGTEGTSGTGGSPSEGTGGLPTSGTVICSHLPQKPQQGHGLHSR